MTPFLSIVTRTYQRPTLLAKCVESLKAQTDKDFEHVIVRDDVGVGIAETYRRLRTQDVLGKYVWVLDDDNLVVDNKLIERLKNLRDENPDIVFVKAKIGGRILPDTETPELAHIDMMNVIVSNDVWMRHRKDFGARYEGDWDFIDAVSNYGYRKSRLDGIVVLAQKISHGNPEDFSLIGEVMKIKTGCAGDGFSYSDGEEILVTERNVSHMESLYRGALADKKDEEELRMPTSKDVMSRSRILIFCPTARLEPETVRSVLAQKLGFGDVMFTFDNPYLYGFRRPHDNIRLNYEKMRQIVLSQGYQKVFVVESDIILPDDALEKLLEIEAPVVTGLYVLRHGSSVPNLMRFNNGPEPGSAMTWLEAIPCWDETIEVSGGCMGCLLIDRSVLENFSFISEDSHSSHDNELMRYCWKNGFKQMARLDVQCGHIRPDGVVLWPDKQSGSRKRERICQT